MKLEDIMEKEEKKGTYAGVRFSDTTTKAVEQYSKDNDIPHPLKAGKMHSTILYSRKHLPDYKAAGNYDKPMVGKPTKFGVWESSPDDGSEPTKCLVLEYECPDLVKRHKSLMKEHEATYDYDPFKSHITLSYDVGDLDHKKLPAFEEEIEIVSEYQEDLDLDWAKSNAKK